MAWLAITEDFVKTKLSGPELNALRTAALAEGQADPLAEIIEDVVKEVRGYVAGCKANTLGAGLTVPDKLKTATMSRIRFELATRLPVKTLLTDDRRTANQDAIKLLTRVAECGFAIEEPLTADTEKLATYTPKIIERCREFTREDQAGT